jgi:hypothetical protein
VSALNTKAETNTTRLLSDHMIGVVRRAWAKAEAFKALDR